MLLLYSIGNMLGCKFLGPGFETHRALFRAASKLSPQHEPLFIISTSRLGGGGGGCLDQSIPIVPIFVLF